MKIETNALTVWRRKSNPSWTLMKTDEPNISQIMFVLSKPSWQFYFCWSSKLFWILLKLLFSNSLFCYSNVFSNMFSTHCCRFNHTHDTSKKDFLVGWIQFTLTFILGIGISDSIGLHLYENMLLYRHFFFFLLSLNKLIQYSMNYTKPSASSDLLLHLIVFFYIYCFWWCKHIYW